MRAENTGTVIGSTVKLVGTLEDRSTIAIYGRVDGEVIAGEEVAVYGGAQVKGPISGKRVSIEGAVRGNVKADERIEILPKGRLAGSLEVKDLVIHSGAVFNGRSTMPEQEAEKVKNETRPAPERETRPEKPSVELE